MLIFYKLIFLKYYILKGKSQKAVDIILGLLDTKISTKQCAKIYLVAVLILEDIQMDKLGILYKCFIRDKKNYPNLERQTGFLLFASIVNFQVYLNYKFVNITESEDFVREQAIVYLDRLKSHQLSKAYQVKLRVYYLSVEVIAKNYKHALEIYNGILDDYWRKLNQELRDMLSFYKAVCELGLGRENIALKIFLDIEGRLNTNKIYDRYYLCKLYEGLGKIYSDRGEIELAKDYYRKAYMAIDNIDIKEHEYEMKKEVQEKLDGLS